MAGPPVVADSGLARFQYWDDTTLAVELPDDGNIPRREYFIGYQWETGGGNFGVDYAHQSILIRDGAPAHNGYFHLLEGHWDHRAGPWHFNVAAGVHGSSNMYRHGDYHDDIFVGRFATLYQIDESDWALGVNGDHRFGHFQIYPRLRWQTTAGSGQLVIDLPQSLAWQSAQQRWRVALERYGEKWATLDDKEQGIESALYIEEWRLALRWRPPQSGALSWELGAGYSFDTRVEYLDLDAGRIESDLDDAAYISAALRF